MVVYFKPDKNNKLYFLYCSSIRLADEQIPLQLQKQMKNKMKNTPLNLDNNYVKPSEIKLI